MLNVVFQLQGVKSGHLYLSRHYLWSRWSLPLHSEMIFTCRLGWVSCWRINWAFCICKSCRLLFVLNSFVSQKWAQLKPPFVLGSFLNTRTLRCVILKAKNCGHQRKVEVLWHWRTSLLQLKENRGGYSVCMKQHLLSKLHSRPALSCFTDHVDGFALSW